MKNITKRITSVILALAVVLTSGAFNQNLIRVQAAEPSNAYALEYNRLVSGIVINGVETTRIDKPTMFWDHAMNGGIDQTLYDVSAISSRYEGIEVYWFHDGAGGVLPALGYVELEDMYTQTNAEIIYNVNNCDCDGYDRNGYKNGYDCEGYDCNGYNREGYDREGYNKEGYDKEGYDREGYNKEGYNREGLDREGYNKKGRIVKKFVMKNAIKSNPNKVAKKTGKKTFALNVYDGNNRIIPSSHYKVKTKKVSVKNGYGKYKVTVKCDSTYKNKVLTKTITVIPSTDFAYGMKNGEYQIVKGVTANLYKEYYSKEAARYTGQGTANLDIQYLDSGRKHIDGIQYVVATDKAYKNRCVKETTKLQPAKQLLVFKGMQGKSFIINDGATYYYKYRLYTIVKGKKIYSEWVHRRETIHM